jgi:acyl-CoA reductase-like NAD-dependent aldehyde dehydrogenase
MEKEHIISDISDLDHLHWQRLSAHHRVRALRGLRSVVAKRSTEIAEAIAKESSQPMEESLSQEVLPVLEMSRYLEKKYPRWLRTQKSRYLRPGFARKSNYIIKQPLGTIAVITPSNFPFSLAMMSLSYLLLAGNTVILKPSERSQYVAPMIAELLAESGLSPRFTGVIPGGPETADRLIQDHRVAKIFFFGSRNAGKTVGRKCMASSKPFVLEMGGGVTAVVLRDADIQLAASGIVWSGMYANGRSCIGTDRVLADSAIEKDFSEHLIPQVSACKKPGESFALDRVDAIRLKRLIEDATAKGAKILRGGNVVISDTGRCTIDPTVITNVHPVSRIMKEEIFGPVIAVSFFDEPSGVADLVNHSYQPVGVSIWTKKRRPAMEIAEKIQAGMIWVNDTSFGLPSLPWLGWNEAGSGSVFSRHSLDEALSTKWISYHPSRFSRRRVWWYPYTTFKREVYKFLAKKLF